LHQVQDGAVIQQAQGLPHGAQIIQLSNGTTAALQTSGDGTGQQVSLYLL